jgi:hypothetical protein
LPPLARRRSTIQGLAIRPEEQKGDSMTKYEQWTHVSPSPSLEPLGTAIPPWAWNAGISWLGSMTRSLSLRSMLSFGPSMRAARSSAPQKKTRRHRSIFLTRGDNIFVKRLDKPFERWQQTGHFLHLPLVLSALDRLYKPLEIFCCLFWQKKHQGAS